MMSTRKHQFIARLMQERDRFELLLNQAGFMRRMTIKGVAGAQSIKDIIARVFAYEQYIADRLAELANDEVYIPCKTYNALNAFMDVFGYPDFGSPLLGDYEANAWVDEKYRNVALDEIILQELDAFSSIVSNLEKMPGDLLEKHNLYDRVADNTYRRYHEYVKDIKRWLARTSSQNP